jgi:bacteriocin biosynthesis cyclodehydratase domain-containing protein
VAAAVRLTTTQIYGDIRIAAAGRGRFGERVVELLAAGHKRSETGRTTALEGLFELEPDAVVIADSVLDPALFRRATELSREYGLPWLPVYVDHPLITIGPFSRPDHPPCFVCSYRRRIQHAPRRATMLALHAAYSEKPETGPKGLLPHHARFAAAIAANRLWRSPADRAAGPEDEVTTIHVTRNLPATHRVIAFLDCEHCGDGGDPTPGPASATLLDLVRRLHHEGPTNSENPAPSGVIA